MTEASDRTDRFGRVWCPECRKPTPVVDQFEDSRYEAHGEVGFWVEVLACGHSNERGQQVVGPAPGAPYAGPQAVVAKSLRPADMRAARSEQPMEDPWA